MGERKLPTSIVVPNAMRVLIADFEAQKHVLDGLVKLGAKARCRVAIAARLIGNVHPTCFTPLGEDVSDRLLNITAAHAGAKAQLILDVGAAGKKPTKDHTLTREDPECLHKHHVLLSPMALRRAEGQTRGFSRQTAAGAPPTARR